MAPADVRRAAKGDRFFGSTVFTEHVVAGFKRLLKNSAWWRI